MTRFKREPRYVVFKLKDIHASLSAAQIEALQTAGETIAAGRARAGKPPFNAVVVEQDWPEFEMVWNAIEARMRGQDMSTESECDRADFEEWLTDNVDPDAPHETSFWDVWQGAIKHEREACAHLANQQLMLPRELPEELLAATNGGYEDWAIAEKAKRVELEQECSDLREENDMLRQANRALGTEAETAEALLVRWVAFFDTSTRSEPFKCIAEDSKRWIKTANDGGQRGA